MKRVIGALVCLVIFLSPSDGAESDVVRVFDRNLKLSNEELNEILKKANLEKYGFEKTVEVSTTSDENGKITTTKTILYSVTDDCSKVVFWESILEQRLPAKLLASGITKTSTKEVQSRIAGRRTKFCKFGLEIHPKMVAKQSDMTKRGASTKASAKCWVVCLKSSIVYN